MSLNSRRLKMNLAATYSLLIRASTVCFLLLPHWSDITISERRANWAAVSTSINYGISQQPITDISQLMPKLCQNQSVICEGSFCIPGVRKCVCDLRMPVQFGRFCLRQIDIETKCFVTSQCNHTVKDAVCIDINSNAILDSESSKFKLDQWQQLYELRQQSLSTLTKETITTTTTMMPNLERQLTARFVVESNNLDDIGYNFEGRNVIISNARNSPYEINYDTNELLSQNHTRRKTNQSERIPNSFLQSLSTNNLNQNKDVHLILKNPLTSELAKKQASGATTTTTTAANPFINAQETTTRNNEFSTQNDAPSTTAATSSTFQQSPDLVVTTTTASYGSGEPIGGRKKAVIKNLNWPPGICSCPHGFMFDSMLRKCLALSLADSHCQVDSDCKQIMMSHCSLDTKKCKCDEPLVWNQVDLACVRPKPVEKIEPPTVSGNATSFIDNLLPPLILAKLLPDYTMMLLIFVFIVIIATLIILRLTVKCFSSSSSALISPKTKKKKQASNNNLPPRSPYATLRRPDHKPSSQLSNFTQATRGRILNYDFEQEVSITKPESNNHSAQSPQPPLDSGGTMQRQSKSQGGRDTVKKIGSRGQKSLADSINQNVSHVEDLGEGQSIELNDNISISQLESESKSDNSVLAIPAPPPNQQPPYMLASAMKGQGSAIAAAAAAVANKRMQLAHKKNLEQQNSGKISDGSPVFL